jgi:hypothetical protein
MIDPASGISSHDALAPDARTADSPAVLGSEKGAPATPQRPRRRMVAAAGDVTFVLLLSFEIIRSLRHAMWHDETQVFMIAAGSSSLWQLFHNLRLEAHPALWYVLVWLITRVTADPIWMQVLHTVLAVGVWVVVYRYSPFSTADKFLLLLSYFLFWEYFVISRSYVLIALIGFAFVLLRERRPRPELALWLLAGLLANVHVYGAIWSMVLAAMLVIEAPQRNSKMMMGAALYLVLLSFAVATIAPPADFGPWPSGGVRFDLYRLKADLNVPFGAFVPLRPDLIRETFAYLAHPGSAAIPRFWNANPTDYFVALLKLDAHHPMRIAAVFAAPIVVCWLIVRAPLRMLEFAFVYFGILLFQNLWDFSGSVRHHGVVFLAFIATVWTSLLRRQPDMVSRSLFAVVLAINAFAGLSTLASELRPWSEGKDAANWIRKNNLENAFLIGWRDGPVSTVAAYLDRPIYYLECQCTGTFIVSNNRRQVLRSPQQFRERLTTAFALAGQRDAILIANRPVSSEQLDTGAPGISATLLQSLTAAPFQENYWIYRLAKK